MQSSWFSRSSSVSSKWRVFPESGGRVPESSTPEVRQVIEFPYRVIYRPSADRIEVVAIIHGRRNVQAPDVR
jgi:plasmid stabilization system protein ParE